MLYMYSTRYSVIGENNPLWFTFLKVLLLDKNYANVKKPLTSQKCLSEH